MIETSRLRTGEESIDLNSFYAGETKSCVERRQSQIKRMRKITVTFPDQVPDDSSTKLTKPVAVT